MKQIANDKLENGSRIYGVIGAAGSGKTSIVNSFKGSKAVFSFDESYSSLTPSDDLHVYSGITSAELVDTNKFVQELNQLTKGIDLVVFDNIADLQDLLIDELVDGKVGKNTNLQAAYGATQKVLRKISRWAMTFDGIVFFTLWSQKLDGYEDAAMNIKAFNAVAGKAKIFGRTFIDSKGKYQVALQPTFEGWAKNTVNKIEKVPNEKFWGATTYKEPTKTEVKKEVK